MIEITRSRPAMALAVAAALAAAVGKVLGVVAFATLSENRPHLLSDLLTAGQWLTATAAVVALLAVGWVAWVMVLRRKWSDFFEVKGAVLATSLVAIGYLIGAARSPSGSTAATIVASVGFGGWAVILTVRAARRSLAEEVRPQLPRQAGVWLGAAGGLVLIAVGTGLSSGATIVDKGLGVAAPALLMFGAAALLAAIALARRKGLIATRHFAGLIAGLGILTAGSGALAIVAGIVFGPFPSLTGLRIGLPIGAAIEAVAFSLLSLAAWNRVRELTVAAVVSPDQQRPWASPCGHRFHPGARFCPECGVPLRSVGATTVVSLGVDPPGAG